jgi:N-methylhydantoinase A/oxoprolinase/acetone carboxylase beta subunit
MSAAFVAQQTGETRVLAFDMGGTTAKASLILDGTPQTVSQFEVGRMERFKAGSGLPVQAATIDLLEVGGGGGSIARVDRLGLLQVGPHSAGSDPGPACYALGGQEPTVTDAMLCLGYLPDALLGGGLALDRERAAMAVRSRLADPLGMDVPQASWGVYSVVAETMASALRVHSIERGIDPRTLTMFAFGGAGPLVAARVAASLRCDRIVVPAGAGVTSAHGFLRSPVAFEVRRSMPGILDELDWKAVDELLYAMEDDARRLIGGSEPEGAGWTVQRSVDLSLAGQAHELAVAVPDGPVDEHTPAVLRTSYVEAYRQRYRDDPPQRALQAVTWAVVVSYRRATPSPAAAAEPAASAPAPTTRSIYVEGRWWEASVCGRDGLPMDPPVAGPLVVEDRESTILVPPGWSAAIDANRNVVITR